jgi:hypothetical protein
MTVTVGEEEALGEALTREWSSGTVVRRGPLACVCVWWHVAPRERLFRLVERSTHVSQ